MSISVQTWERKSSWSRTSSSNPWRYPHASLHFYKVLSHPDTHSAPTDFRPSFRQQSQYPSAPSSHLCQIKTHLVPPACLPSLATACTLRVGSLSPFTYPPKIQMFRYPTTVWKCFLLIASGMHSHLALNRKQCSVFLTTLSWQTFGTPFHFELPWPVRRP